MANADFANGLRPVRHAYGSPFMGAGRRYSALSSYATPLFIGDPVVKTGIADADGFSVINLATAGAGNAITGVVIGFEDVPSMLLGYGAASTTRRVIVADDPTLLFEVQEDGAGGAIALASVGLNVDLIAAAGSTVNRVSGWMADSSTVAAGATLQCNIIEFQHREDNEFPLTKAKLLVRINNHSEIPAIAGV